MGSHASKVAQVPPSCNLKNLVSECQKLTIQKIACVLPTTVYRRHLSASNSDKHDWQCLMTAFSFVKTEHPVFQLSTILEWVKVNVATVIPFPENWKRVALLLPEDNDDELYFYRNNIFSELVRLYKAQIKEHGELNGPHFSSETIESLSLLLLERNRWYFRTSFK